MFSPTDAATLFNAVMVKHSLPLRAKASEFVFGDQCILLAFSSDGEKQAEQLFDQLFPRMQDGLYEHFTTYGGFKGIVSSGCLRLYNLHKRFKSGEFRTFCRDHGLDGYLRTSNDGSEQGYFSDLMEDLFYISLVTEEAKDSVPHWEKFANDHKGVRLTIRVSLADGYPNFRKISYQQADRLTAFKDLQDAFSEKGFIFVMSGLARIPAFYQRQEYSSQFEYRLLAKRFPKIPDLFPFAVHNERGLIKFIESDLTTNSHDWFNLSLVGVTVGSACSLAGTNRYLKNHSKFPALEAQSHFR